MSRLRTAALMAAVLAGSAFLYAQKPFKQYRETAERYEDFPLPDDWQRPAEWVFGRLKFPDIRRFEFGIDIMWTMDYPRGDRHLAHAIRRLTSIDARSIEQVVEADESDDIFNWPFLYAVEVGYMDLTEPEAAKLRTFLDRGGFLMVDDFHGTQEWNNFEANLDLIIPNAVIEDLTARDAVFHTSADVNELIQIPSAAYLQTGLTYEFQKQGAEKPYFRAVRDDKGRIRIIICHNMDLGDAIEHSDNPDYPERFSAIAYRVLNDYVLYNLTH
jgi:hypothetical protein